MNVGKTVRRFLKILLVLVFVAVVGVLVLAYTVKFRISDREAMEKMKDARTTVRIEYLEKYGRKTRSILAKKGNKTLVLLLHGSPSSCAQWTPLVNDQVLGEKADFLLIDRPGYGYSSFGQPILSVKRVAEIVHEIVMKYAADYENIYVLGTSYGGTVAARLLMDFPGFFDGALLISSSMAPGEEFVYPISYFMERAPWLFPKLLMVANEEKLSHYEQLKEMEPYWKKIADPVLFIHSTTDDLVFPANVTFVLERLRPNVPVETIWVENAEHSLYWAERPLFIQTLNDFLDGKILPALKEDFRRQ